MKKISLFLSLCIFMQSFAFAEPATGLKEVLDEYRYALTVEWDQKDERVLENIKAEFAQDLKDVIVSQNLSVKDLKDLLKSNKRELKLDDELLATLEGANGMVNVERANELLSERSHEMYSQGSSWAPDFGSILLYGLLGLFVFEIVVLIITTPDDVCPNPASHPNDVPYACEYSN